MNRPNPGRRQAAATVRRPRGAAALSAVLIVAAGAALVAVASHAARSAALAPAAAESLPPGWYGRFSALDAKGTPGEPVAAFSPVPAFALEAGDSVHPLLPASGFEATFDAQVNVPDSGRYRFGAELDGCRVEIRLFGNALKDQVVASTSRPSTGSAPSLLTPWLTLKPGPLNVQYTITRSGSGQARFRAVWEMQRAGLKGFGLEPIPALVTAVSPYGEKETAAAFVRQHGEVLLDTLGCLNCHGDGGGFKGPDLAGVGSRLGPSWLGEWVLSPQHVKPGSGMPAVLGDTAKDKADAAAITQFLLGLGRVGEPVAESVATEPQTVTQGRDLYLSIGCVACHGAANKSGAEAPAPFGALKGKWRPSSLAEFLVDPAKTRPHGRMPGMNLTKAEADLLATYLITEWGAPAADSVAFDPSLAETGKAAFAARGCAACHEAPDAATGRPITRADTSRPLTSLRPGKGCLDPADHASPRYTLSAGDRTAMEAAIDARQKHANGAGLAGSPAFDALHRLAALNCSACHEYNETGGVAEPYRASFTTLTEADLGDEGRIPPRLTGVGGKLNTVWMKAVLHDAGRARPYMAARMPQFPRASLGDLAEELSSVDGVFADSAPTEPASSQELIRSGVLLAGETGLNCISCHVFGDSPSTGTPGPSITAFAERLRYDWFSRYMKDPGRVKQGTRMTNFFQTGQSTITEVYGGNTQQQIDALWSYFNLSDFMPPPQGIEQAQGFKLRVGDRPKVVRTFLKRAGSRGIAVGYPVERGGIHFAFDAGAVRLVEAWEGDFLDASGAWAGRGGTVAGGQGSRVWTAPAGPPILIDAGPNGGDEAGTTAGYHFRGYSFDDRGTPTFEYDIDWKPGEPPVHVRETFEPMVTAGKAENAATIRRHFELSGLPTGTNGTPTIWLNPGPEAVCTASEPGLAKVAGPDGAAWFSITPGASLQGRPMTVTMEVTP
ncbi:MAG: c-type cytochrome [Phycisphaeraceae bacterium]|nr:c-type cytochrome [Phycisphaeraceae bacterium]